MSESHICVGGPLQGRSFTEPPAGYSCTVISRGYHQGERIVWEYNGTDCLDELLAAAVRYGKFRDPHGTYQDVERLTHILKQSAGGDEFDKEIDNEPYRGLPFDPTEPKA